MTLQVWHIERPGPTDASYASWFQGWRQEKISLPGFDTFRRKEHVLVGYGEAGLLLVYRPDDVACGAVDGLLGWSRRLHGRIPSGAQAVLAYRPSVRWRSEAVDMAILACSDALSALTENTLRHPLTVITALEYDERSRPLVRLAHLLRAERPDPRLDFALSRHADVLSDIAARGGVPSSVGWSFLVSQTPRGFA